MAQSDGPAAELDSEIVESAAFHAGAQCAGILFFSDIEDDGADLGLPDRVRDIELFTHFPNRFEVHALEAHIQRDRLQLEGNRREMPVTGQGVKQSRAVLSAGQADGNFVAGLYHVVFFYCPSHRA